MKFYQQLSVKEKKAFREGVADVRQKQKEQMKDWDDLLCAPLRDAIRAGERVVKNEISVNEYFKVQEDTQKRVRLVMALMKVSK